MQSKIFLLIFLLMMICIPTIVHAQPSFADDISDAPIDGGFSILISSSIGFVYKNMQQRKSNKKADSF